MCWSGGNQLTDAALSPVGFVEASFDAGHRGPELRCCFKESESDCNGPSCAPACLPLRFTTHLIYSPQTHSHNCTLHTHFLSRLSLLSLSLSLSLSASPPFLPCCLSTSACIHKPGLVLADILCFQLLRALLLPYELTNRGCNLNNKS